MKAIVLAAALLAPLSAASAADWAPSAAVLASAAKTQHHCSQPDVLESMYKKLWEMEEKLNGLNSPEYYDLWIKNYFGDIRRTADNYAKLGKNVAPDPRPMSDDAMREFLLAGTDFVIENFYADGSSMLINAGVKVRELVIGEAQTVKLRAGLTKQIAELKAAIDRRSSK